MTTVTILKANIAHTIASVSAFFESLSAAPIGKFNSVACDFHDTFTTKHSFSSDVCEYFPDDKTLDNISDADYSRTSNLLESLFETKNAIVGNASFLILHNETNDEVKAEFIELRDNIVVLQKQLDIFITEFSTVDFSGYYPEEAAA